MLATRLRELYREAPITEAHPKALLRFLKLSPELAKWKEVQNHHMLWPLKGALHLTMSATQCLRQ
jgi:hypothetical protein